MRLAKAIVLGMALFGAFGAGLGVLVRLLMPVVTLMGWASTLYILGMVSLLVAIIARILHECP